MALKVVLMVGSDAHPKPQGGECVVRSPEKRVLMLVKIKKVMTNKSVSSKVRCNIKILNVILDKWG